MTSQQIFINARLVVKAIKITSRDQIDEVLVAILRLGKQHQVVVPVRIGAGLVTLLGDVHLTANHGMNAFFVGFVIELNCAKEIAMVGHGDSWHALLLGDGHQLLDIAGAIQQRVIGMAVKVNERTFGHERFSFSLPGGAGRGALVPPVTVTIREICRSTGKTTLTRCL